MVELVSNGSFYWYVLAYVVAVVGCAVALPRARRVDDRETRVGLVALLVTSGGWATAQLGYLLAPTGPVQYALYLAGLIVGLTTIGGWLYFCSAYTGQTYHRNRSIRRLSVVVFVSVVVGSCVAAVVCSPPAPPPPPAPEPPPPSSLLDPSKIPTSLLPSLISSVTGEFAFPESIRFFEPSMISWSRYVVPSVVW